MAADPIEKADRYERLLSQAIDAAEPTPRADTPLAAAAESFADMARSYLEDGRHFAEASDHVNAVAAYSYGHAWLDAGARLGLFEVPSDESLFAV